MGYISEYENASLQTASFRLQKVRAAKGSGGGNK